MRGVNVAVIGHTGWDIVSTPSGTSERRLGPLHADGLA